jgi:tetratricopeptide (TPR) repeat protein
LREVGLKLGRWEEARADALAALERKKKIGALIEIALDEGDAARALELLPRVEQHAWRDYGQEVAEAAEKDHPRAALALYREMAERAIAERHRGAYRQAAQHLKRAKALSERLAARADWETYLRELHTRYAKLPALQDELRKARLYILNNQW